MVQQLVPKQRLDALERTAVPAAQRSMAVMLVRCVQPSQMPLLAWQTAVQAGASLWHKATATCMALFACITASKNH